jgi:hypothetical protein
VNTHRFSAEVPVGDAVDAERKAAKLCADYFGDQPHEWSVSTSARMRSDGEVAWLVAEVDGWAIEAD